ncbi:MAG: thioesterase II family protein [Burkholderiaceae bacterium]
MQSFLKEQVTAEHRSSLRRYGGRPQPLVRLVCFSWCGAGASAYRRLAATLPDHIELLAVQLPGREDRFAEKKLLRMEQIIEHVIDDIIAVFDRPLILFGHSMGALVANEMALALRDRVGREPDGLIVSGHASPDNKEPNTRCWHTANDADFIANLRQLGGTPASVLEDEQMMRMLLPMLRADYEVLETYTYKPDRILSCPLIVCAGEKDTEVSRASMDAWQRYSTKTIKVHWFNGDHFYLSANPQALTQYLGEWTAPTGFIFSNKTASV